MTELASLPQHPSSVLIILARQAARNAVKHELRARGIKVQHMRASEISATADLYFKANVRALLEDAWRMCQACPDLMRFHEKAVKDRERKTVHILFKTVDSAAKTGAQDKEMTL